MYYAVSIAEDVCHEVQQDETDEDISLLLKQSQKCPVIGSL